MPPAGSPFTRMAKVVAGAMAHRKAQVPEDASKLHEVEGHMSIVPGQVKIDRQGWSAGGAGDGGTSS